MHSRLSGSRKKQEGTASIWLGRGGGGGKSLASSAAVRPFCPARRGMLISHKRERKESPNAVKAAKKGEETRQARIAQKSAFLFLDMAATISNATYSN